MHGAGTPNLELDVATSPAFITATLTAIDAATDHTVVIDCGAITFMDSSAYYAMVALTRYALARGHPLVLKNLTVLCARVLSLCDWDHELTIEDI
jgi:anti-anti-sigma factor